MGRSRRHEHAIRLAIGPVGIHHSMRLN
jgi:hypothetical protein